MAKEERERPGITRFERARIIGSRALQIASGAPFHIKLSKKELEEIGYDPIAIAKKEFDAGVIPMTVSRPFPEKVTESEEEKE
ncbi:MAG: DNA-directed RNA polymerase subunit K [Nanoarchaeota archaeon]|nr:DNA-directed RNA polymerase subunit K [Nanoarchaeota archaeon]